MREHTLGLPERPGPRFTGRAKPTVGEIVSTAGQPLDVATRARVEPRFGHDFSQVRVHADRTAGDSAEAVNALAYTVGPHIVFGDGRYAPGTAEGEALLVHELTHVLQQRRAPAVARPGPGTPQMCGVGEDEARASVVAFTAGRRPPPVSPVVPGVQRQKVDSGPEAEFVKKDDWHGAAWALSRLDQAELQTRLQTMSSRRRQLIVEGAFHGGAWRRDLIAVADKISHRDAVIGGVRFFVWKQQWAEAGTYLCGLNNADIRRVAKQLDLSSADLRAIADAQPAKIQAERLNIAFFGEDAKFTLGLRKDLVDPKKAPDLVVGWLVADPLVKPYAEKKWPGAARPKLNVVPDPKWAGTYEQHQAGKVDPETGATVTSEQARAKAVMSYGFTTETDEIFVKKGESSPAAVIHEAVHALAPDTFEGEFGRAVNEGTTEYFARRVARAAGRHPGTAYQEETAGVAALAAVVGDALLADAFFTGKTLALTSKVEEIKGYDKLRAWREAMRQTSTLKDAAKALE